MVGFHSLKLEYIVPKNEIFYISWILDACDELAMLETIDVKRGHIVIHTTKFLEKYVRGLMRSLQNETIAVTEL
ncbi:MAG: DUF4911 domain-containing protein [Synergistaceae bacterium]|nr:DUF4911 domain-containing protein [Synergistaceae bacterium]